MSVTNLFTVIYATDIGTEVYIMDLCIYYLNYLCKCWHRPCKRQFRKSKTDIWIAFVNVWMAFVNLWIALPTCLCWLPTCLCWLPSFPSTNVGCRHMLWFTWSQQKFFWNAENQLVIINFSVSLSFYSYFWL